MTMRWLVKYKRPVLFIVTISLFILFACILYKIFGHHIVKAMYEGRSISILNRIIDNQSGNSLEFYLKKADNYFFISLIFILVIIQFLLIIFRPKLIMKWLQTKELLNHHTDFIDAIPDSHICLWIALAAGLSLYIELMIIRLHSSYFQLFAYFKNVSLLSCFLGLGIGYANGSKRPLATPFVLSFLALQIIFMHLLRYSPLLKLLQNPISEQIAFGLNHTGEIIHTLVVYAFVALIFAFNALCFIPLGHLTSRLMMRRRNLVSYSWNLIGSLVGILIFSFVSFICTPPSVWIILAAVGLMFFLRRSIATFFPSILAIITVLIFLAIPFRLNQFSVYSPYQILTLLLPKNASPVLETSNTFYQSILNLSEESIRNNEVLKMAAHYYSLPYYFKPKPAQVLIVGSGTGNDVAAAIRNGAKQIDAVEIDPVILQFGKQLHPESPYQANNVQVFVEDARAFIKHTNKRYDLIVYGLLDSHILLSGSSGGIRLDSYVYTVEGFREAKSRLKDDGIISLTFCLVKPELGRKLFMMLQEAFDGESPVVYKSSYEGGYTFLIGAGLKKNMLPLTDTVEEVTNKFADSKIMADKSTDNWPFLYMPVRKYPVSYVIIMLILLIISILYIRELIDGLDNGFSVSCFFLGAGFMLIETKGITELALLYGSTWMVVSVVITAILILAFLANLIVMKMETPSNVMSYALLSLSLVVGFSLSFTYFNNFGPWISRIIMAIAVTLPLFFSGFIFSTEIKNNNSIAVSLSSNLLGAMLGGFLEYNSMYFGFRSLYIFAFIIYGFAFLGSMRAK